MENLDLQTIIDGLITLISEASLSIWFVEGTGLGAILLTVIAVVLIRSGILGKSCLADIITAWRGPFNRALPAGCPLNESAL